MEQSYLKLILDGGFIIVLLGICSVVSLAIILERLVKIRKSKFIQEPLYQKASESVRANDDEALNDVLHQKTFFLGDYLKKIAFENGNSGNSLPTLIETAVNRISEILEQRLHVLQFIIQLSPLLGILGTVIGLTDSFLALGNLGGGEKFYFLAQGIGKALSTTIVGLGVAIFTMFGHYLVRYRSVKIISILNQQLEDFSYLYARRHEEDRSFQRQ